MFDNIIPQRNVYFSLLAAHCDRLVAGANATLRLFTILGQEITSDQRRELIDEVNLDETSADDIKSEYVRLLFESFTTPLNRDQMHALILDLDRVLDTLQSAANAVNMYNIKASTSAARTLASLASDACLRLSRAVTALGTRRPSTEISAFCREIDAFETQAETVMRDAVTQLFREEGDEAAAWNALKLRRLYFTQHAVLDGCKRASHTIEEILIENA